MTDETICETFYKKLNSFVTNVINRDVTPKIDSLRDGKADNNHTQYSTTVKHSNALSNLGTSANANQYTINGKINEKVGSLINSPTNTSKEILANSDLNDCTDNGFYYCNLSNNEIATISNCPLTRGFSMFVEKNYTYNETGIKQVITEHDGATTYIRTFFTDFSNVFHDSGWKPLYYDTGWQSITNASGFSTYDSNGSPTRYRRIGKIVHIEGIFKNSSKLASGSSTTMGTISDTSCRPQKDQYALMQGSGKSFFLLKVQPNGQIHIERYGSTANQETGVNSWLHCYITYFVE